MKKLLLILSGALLFFASCYKEKERVKASDALAGLGNDSTVWQIQSHVNARVDIWDCRVAHELVFYKDSTGYLYYPTPCDSTDNDTLKFRWMTSTDNQNLYLTHINGVPGAVATLGISYYDETTLRTRGGNYPKKFLDGYFVAKPKE